MRFSRRRSQRLALGLVCCIAGLLCVAATSPDVTIRDAWARATPPAAKFGAIYVTLTSATGDRLVGASVARSIAARTQLHETVMITDSLGERMTMREVPSITLAPGDSVRLGPGGLHIMLIGLKKPLRAGARLPVTLSFENAGRHKVMALVRDE